MKIIYLDCFSGISGDMTLAALVDAGADQTYIESELQKLSVEPFRLEWSRVVKTGISALKMDVRIDEETEPHHHRHYGDIAEMIRQAGFNERVTEISLAIFLRIAVAEAKIHGVPLESVHFHEVGAIDSIVDIVGVALALDSLQADKLYSSAIPLGSGTVRCDHGLYPVPAPATLEIMKGLPVAASRHAVEMTTPTGAGIVAGVVSEFTPGMPPMVVEAVGYGAGTRNLPDQPNVLRVIVGQAREAQVAANHGDTDKHAHNHEHGHSHEHVHGHEHSHSHKHDHSHIHGHSHTHEHSHTHGHSHSHAHKDKLPKSIRKRQSAPNL